MFSFSELFFRTSESFSPNLPFYKMMIFILDDFDLAVAFSNAAVVAGTLTIMMSLVDGLSKSRVFRGLAFFGTLTPSIVHNGVSLNKDLFVMFFTVSLLVGTSKLLQTLPKILSITGFRQTVLFLLIVTFSWQCLETQRPYFMEFYYSSLAVIGLIYIIQRFLLLSVNLRTLIAASGAFVGVVVALMLKWSEITKIFTTYWGNAAIVSIHEIITGDTPVDLWNGVLLGFFGLMHSYLMFLTLLFDNFQVGAVALVAGVVEGAVFFFSLVLFYIFYRGPWQTKCLVTSFMILHLGIQSWASPNFGAYLRLRLFEHVFFTTIGLSILVDYLGRRYKFLDIVVIERPDFLRNYGPKVSQ